MSALAGVERWFVRAGLFILPLAYAWNTYDQFVLPKLLAARALLIGMLILFVFRTVGRGVLTWKRTALDLPIIAFLASAALSTAFATNVNIAIFGTYSRYDGLLTLLTYAGLFWMSVQALSSAADARTLLRVLVASGYAVAAVAIVQSVHDSIRDAEFVPAFGTLGNANVLGAFLAMVLALALHELIGAESWSGKVLALNVVALVGVALLLSFSRSAWLGAAVGTMVVLAGRRLEFSRWVPIASVAAILIVALFIAARALSGGFELERLLAARATTIFDLHAWGGSRLHIWQDSLTLISTRPIAGYGPDNFGLVFPRFESGDWGAGIRGIRQQVDKAHAEVLQVAATQGLVGLAAYLFMLATFVRAFWQGRTAEAAVGAFGAWIAYQVTVQLNFTAPPAAFPFWIFAAAAIVTWGAASPSRVVLVRGTNAIGMAAVAGLALLAAVVLIFPYYADVQLRAAVDADFSGQVDEAYSLAGGARRLGPRESVYAVEVGNITFQQSDWAAARSAYEEAARLGTYNPLVYRNLALADGKLGLVAEGLAAARQAVELDRFDPANQAVLAEFEKIA